MCLCNAALSCMAKITGEFPRDRRVRVIAYTEQKPAASAALVHLDPELARSSPHQVGSVRIPRRSTAAGTALGHGHDSPTPPEFALNN